MRLLPVLCLLALGCSESPPPADASPDGAAPLDGGADAGAPGDVVDASRPDAVAVADARPADAADGAVAPDAPDAVAVADAADGAVGVDAPDAAEDAAGADAQDVVEAANVVDAGPADAGPRVYALDPPPGALEARVLYLRTCRSTDGGPCDATATDTAMGATCTRTGSRLNFNLRACAGPRGSCIEVTGLFPDYRTSTGATIALVGSLANQGRNLRIRAGASAGGRQSFHVQFDAPAGAEVGAIGIPGRTVDAALADLWLLGCAVQ